MKKKILASFAIITLATTGILTTDAHFNSTEAEAAKQKPYTIIYDNTWYEYKLDKNGEEIKSSKKKVTKKDYLKITPGATVKQALANRCAELNLPAPKNDWSGLEKKVEEKMKQQAEGTLQVGFNGEFRKYSPPEMWLNYEIGEVTNENHWIYYYCQENGSLGGGFDIPNDKRTHYRLDTEGLTDREAQKKLEEFCRKNNCG